MHRSGGKVRVFFFLEISVKDVVITGVATAPATLPIMQTIHLPPPPTWFDEAHAHACQSSHRRCFIGNNK